MAGAVVLVVAILAAGCTGSSSTGKSSGEQAATSTTGTAATTGAPTIEQAREAGAVARAIDAEPNRAAEILAEHGMTAQSLESLIFEIAKDPKLSEAYEEARGASSG
jgi:hypothetical protein